MPRRFGNKTARIARFNETGNLVRKMERIQRAINRRGNSFPHEQAQLARLAHKIGKVQGGKR